MKRRWNWLSMAVALVFAGFTANATVLVEDHFNYATTNLVGNTPAIGGTWGGNDCAGVVSGSLTSPSGFASASGNKVSLGRASGAQTNTFTTQSSGTVYISYLAQFSNLNGKAFLIGGLSSLGGAEYAQLEYSNVTGNAWFNLGLGGRSTTLGPLPTNQYTTGTAHLIVVSYEFVSGTANDIMRIWIDPDSSTFGGTEPAPYQTMTGFTDTASLNTVDLKSSSNVPADTFIDELRVGTSWADVTPVQIQDQTITFPNPGNQLTTGSVTLTASASSGLPVVYAVVSGPASLDGSNVTFTGAGSVTLSANQAGNGSWNAAPQTNVTFSVSKATASVSLSGLSQTYDGASKTVTATTTPSGKTVDITYDGSAIAPVNAGSYTVVGTVNDTMYQGGATGTLTVAKADQTISFTNPGNQISTNTVTLSATASSGLTVSYGVVSGAASINGSQVTFTGAGSVTLSADQSGNANWNAAAQTNVTFDVQAAIAPSVTIVSLQGNLNTGTANINFVKPTETVAGETRFYTNGFSTALITNGTPCTGGSYTGPTMYGAFRHSQTGSAPGTFTTFRYGSADQIYVTPTNTSAAAELDYLFVFKQAQFAGGLSSGAVTFAASSSFTLTSSVYNASTKSMRAAVLNNGTWYLSQTEDTTLSGNVRTINLTTGSLWAAWTPMDAAPQSFTVSGSQLTDIEAVGLYGHLTKTTNGTSFSLTLTSINIDGFTGSGAAQKADQTITFANPGSQIATNSLTLGAAASSGLPVTYGVVSGPASISGGSNVTFSGAGSVTLSADQSGDTDWNAAPQTNVTFSISKANASVSLSGLSQIYDGSAKSVTVTTVPSGLTVDVTYNGSAAPPSSTGSYAVVATVNSALYQGTASGTLTISAAASPTEVRAFRIETRTVNVYALSNTVSGVSKPSDSGATVRAGRQNANYLTAAVMMFQLPDLNGATPLSAQLKFRVGSRSTMNSNNNCNLNIEAVRSAPLGSPVSTNDYSGIGLGANEVLIQEKISLWNDTGIPRDYQMSGAATNTLGAWIADQYDSVGVGGVIFLRLAPDRDPVSSYYYSTLLDSIELVITTAGDTDPAGGVSSNVTAQIGANTFSWTFDRNVTWGRFIDGMPWVVIPAGGLNLVSAYPARSNNASVYFYKTLTNATLTNATINVTVKNPPLDHTFDTGTWSYVDNTNGVFGWDSRAQDGQSSPKYNASLGWDGTTPLALAAGDSVTTAKSMSQNPMPSRATSLEALAVLTVLSTNPPSDAFRPAVIRTGTDRTNPEILRYSDLIDLSPYLISNPVGLTTDLRGTNVSAIANRYTFNEISACLPGPGFNATGYIASEGDSALCNTYAWPGGSVYGGTLGNYIGQLAVGSLAGWMTEDERKFCRIRYIQRAIDVYGAVKGGLCMEEGCGVRPGYSTLLTVAGVMLNHSGMKSVNNGVNGVPPWYIFADYACHFHTDGVSTNDLVPGETTERLISLYSATTNNYPELNKTNCQPVAAASATTMTMKTNFYWGGSRPIYNIINLKFKIVSGTGAGSTIYVITNALVATNLALTDDERFRTTDTAAAVLYTNGIDGAVYGYCYGGKVGVKPSFQNGAPDSSSVLTFSITTRDADNVMSDDACWYWCPDGILPNTTPVVFEREKSISTSPQTEYSGVHAGATIDNLIALYALGQQDLYKGAVDKYLINSGERPGHGEFLFQAATYFDAIYSGSATTPTKGSTRGALWKQEVLNRVGATFQFTGGTTGSLDIPQTDAKMWYEP